MGSNECGSGMAPLYREFLGRPNSQFGGRSAQPPMSQQKGTVTPDITPWQVTADVFDTETLGLRSTGR